MQLDLWLKRIWFLIGCLILLLVLVATGAWVVDLFKGHPDTGPLVGTAAQPQGKDSLVVQDLGFDFPIPVGTTGLMVVSVSIRDLTSAVPRSDLRIQSPEESNLSSYSKFAPPQRAMVNILFLRRDGSESYPLLEKRAFIKRADIPAETDSLRRFLLFDIAFDDTDRDGRLTPQDSSRYYISDLDGHRLVPLVDRAFELSSYEESSDHKSIYLLLRHKVENVKPIDWPERLHLYDVATRSMSPFPKDGQALERMRRTLLNNQ
jgi:hypothetical protein